MGLAIFVAALAVFAIVAYTFADYIIPNDDDL